MVNIKYQKKYDIMKPWIYETTDNGKNNPDNKIKLNNNHIGACAEPSREFRGIIENPSSRTCEDSSSAECRDIPHLRTVET